MILKIFSDGGSLGNPGPAASSFVVYQENKIIFKYSLAIGQTTNNIAEYTALIKALEWLKSYLSSFPNLKISKIEFFSDSKLVVYQLNGYFKVKSAAIREFIFKIRSLENQINLPVFYRHISRQKNYLADLLVKKVLKFHQSP